MLSFTLFFLKGSTGTAMSGMPEFRTDSTRILEFRGIPEFGLQAASHLPAKAAKLPPTPHTAEDHEDSKTPTPGVLEKRSRHYLCISQFFSNCSILTNAPYRSHSIALHSSISSRHQSPTHACSLRELFLDTVPFITVHMSVSL